MVLVVQVKNTVLFEDVDEEGYLYLGTLDEIEALEGDYTEYSDGTYFMRKGIRNGTFVVDKELTALGFDGTEGTDWAITYPRSSSGPFHHSSPVAVNPIVGVPTASPPTCSVPAMRDPVLYANGLAVAMCKFNFVLYIWEGR